MVKVGFNPFQVKEFVRCSRNGLFFYRSKVILCQALHPLGFRAFFYGVSAVNKTEQELVELGKKVAHNYRLIVGVAAFFYGCFVFYQNQQSNSLEISNLKERTSKLEDRVTANEKNFNMTSVKLDTTLSRISTDLQYIKEKLIGKALER